MMRSIFPVVQFQEWIRHRGDVNDGPMARIIRFADHCHHDQAADQYIVATPH